MISIALAVPGIEAAALVAVAQWFDLDPYGDFGMYILFALLAGFVMLAIGCSVFAARIATAASDESRCRSRWIKWSLLMLLGQIILTPVVAGMILVFFMV